MKQSIIAALVFALLSGSAFAGEGRGHGRKSSGNQAQGQAQGQAQLQAQGQAQGQTQRATGGNSSAAGGGGGAGGSGTAVASVGPMNFAFTTPAASGPSTAFVQNDYSGIPRQAPAMGNSYISTSNGCDSASGLGFVFPGGGVNFSGTALRMMCEGRLNSQAHKALGDEDKARKVMRVVDEYACSQDAVWAKIAREEGICKPDTAPSATEINPAFNSK